MPKQTVAGLKASGREVRAKRTAATPTNKQTSTRRVESDPATGQERPRKKRKTRQSTGDETSQADAVVQPPVKQLPAQAVPRAPQKTTNGIRSSLSLDHGSEPTTTDQITKNNHGIEQTKVVQEVKDDADKRVLRSQGSTRGTSELPLFFPDYEEFVFGSENHSDTLTADSVLYLTDEKVLKETHILPIRDQQAMSPPQKSTPGDNVRLHESLRTKATRTLVHPPQEVLDLSVYQAEAKQFPLDPLSDDVYLIAHKRGERHEKKLRNLEKEKAMHEKVQLNRLYDELRGPDWLRTMGITGITDTEKKLFEPKRDHYTIKVKRLLGKFDEWRDKEKEMRLKKERAAARTAEEEAEYTDDEGEDDGEDNDDGTNADEEQDDGPEAQASEKGDTDDRNDEVFILPVRKLKRSKNRPLSQPDESALQLLQEASLAQALQKEPMLQLSASKIGQETETPFTSFFLKPHERLACISRHRHGRHLKAFGQPIPDVPEEDVFRLPEDLKSSITRER